jgi:hypothetical protein
MKTYKVFISESANQDIEKLVDFLFTKLSRESSDTYLSCYFKLAAASTFCWSRC